MKKKLAVIQALLLCIAVMCGVYLIRYYQGLKRAGEEYGEIRNIVRTAQIADAQSKYLGYSAEDARVLESYAELSKTNSDMAGWIKIPDTKIDYPVVRYSDNSFYLHKNFEKKYLYSGIPFMDYQCEENSHNIIIYAHNMRDGSMFAALSDYENKAFYDKHRRIYFDSLNERGVYEIIAAFSTKVGSKNEFKYYNYAYIENEDQYNEYVSSVKKLSYYNTGVTAHYGERLVTLSTCAYHTSNERFVVVAKKI